MKQVVAILGSPSEIYTVDQREFWDYGSVAYDPITHKNIKSLELVFVHRVVHAVNFSYQ